MKQLQVGLLGYGLAGRVFHAPLIQSCKQLKLNTIATRNFEGKELPVGIKQASYDAALADPELDLIVIATENSSHFPLAFEAIKSGKHVVVDKPITNRLADAEALFAHARNYDKFISVFQNRRWDSGIKTAQNMVSTNGVGKISYAEFHFDRFQPVPKDGWRETPGLGSGVLFDLGPHLIDHAYCMFGMPIAVNAEVVSQRDGAEVDDFFHICLDYGKTKVVLHASCRMASNDLRISIHGDAGSFYQYGIDGQEDILKSGGNPNDESWGLTPDGHAFIVGSDGAKKEVKMIAGSYQDYYAGVANSILRGDPSPVSTTDVQNTMTILQAAIKSGVERRTIALV